MSAVDDLKRLAEAATQGPWIVRIYEGIEEAQITPVDNELCRIAGSYLKAEATFIAAANPKAILELLADNRAKDERIDEARGMLTFYCEDYCTCEQDPHVGSDTDGFDPPCLTVLIKEWIARLTADDAAQRKG